jgi:hypothetical protein
MTFVNWLTLTGLVLAAMTFLGTLLSYWLKLSLKAELSDFREELTKNFKTQFQDSTLAEVRRETITKDLQVVHEDLAKLHTRINEVGDYAHRNNHEVRNKIQIMELTLGEMRAQQNRQNAGK